MVQAVLHRREKRYISLNRKNKHNKIVMDINPPNPETLDPPHKTRWGTERSRSATHSPTQLPHFPKYKPTGLSRPQNQHSVGVVVDLLHDIEAIARQWQDQLDEIHDQITALYHQGPIIEGWLESSPTAIHGDTNAGSLSSYRLCGLKDNGEVWSRPCRSEEVASISLAIHRYQQLRHFLSQKHRIEERLSQLTQSLNGLHQHLGDE